MLNRTYVVGIFNCWVPFPSLWGTRAWPTLRAAHRSCTGTRHKTKPTIFYNGVGCEGDTLLFSSNVFTVETSPSSCNDSAGPHTWSHLTLSERLVNHSHLESQINLTCMFLDCGRTLEQREKTHAGTERARKLHNQTQPIKPCKITMQIGHIIKYSRTMLLYDSIFSYTLRL